MPLAPTTRRWLRRGLLVAAVLALASCKAVRYYTQAIGGQLDMLRRAKPIASVLAEPSTEAAVKSKLQLIQRLSAFAKAELGLPAEKQFQTYSDLGRPYAVWVVYAAPEFSIEPKGWWYPVVGTLHYRGFFDVESAKAEKKRLEAQGFDVFAGGVEAYSTLGWFSDPVLNTFIKRDELDLAELIFHELTHARLFVPGGTDFNEALASTVGQEGVRRWLLSQGRHADLAKWEAGLKKDREIVELVLRTRSRLEKEYAKPALSDEQRRAGKAKALADMQAEYQSIRARWQGDSRYDKWFARPINNARLNTIATYFDLVPAFQKVLRECDGDLERFFKQVKAKPVTKSADSAEKR